MLTAPVYKYNVPAPSSRVYFADIDTGETLYEGILIGNSEAGIWRGKRYMDTAFGIDVVDVKTRIGGLVTAEWWPGRRVVAKLWSPAHGYDGKARVEFKALVSRERGWVGNESPACNTAGSATMGAETMWWKAVAD